MLRRRIALIVMALALLAARKDEAPLIDLIAFCAGIALYPLALALVAALVAWPFALIAYAWLIWRWRAHGRTPPSLVRALTPAFLRPRQAPTPTVGDAPLTPRAPAPEEAPTLELPALEAPRTLPVHPARPRPSGAPTEGAIVSTTSREQP